MRILKIAGRNLASLAGEFCVDFTREPLASAGLFAISGPTGAGKSTLLDAMCLALYDATPRLLKRKGTSLLPDVGTDTVSVQDPRTLLRRGASEAWSEVDFVGNDGLSYRARWSIKRSYGRASGALQKTKMSLHRLPELIPLGGTNTEAMQEIEQRIGLSFEQFTRAVLLAQNEFSAFLKTEENERGELLETLTGSVIYSEISKRAFERFRTEQARMRELAARLADQAPLEPEARAALDADAAAADAVLLQLDERRALLEQQVRWQQESEKLQQQVQAAQTALAAGVAAVDAAAARRRHLATIDAVQPARQLVAESARIHAETGAAQASIAACTEALAQAAAGQEQAAQAHAAASAQLQAAEAAQRAAAPRLDQAKALDATIAALTPSHLGAAKARDSSALGLAGASAAAGELANKLAAARAALEQEKAWLDSHRQHEPLAAQWPRWDRLFAQAERESAREQALAAELAQAQAALTEAAAGEQLAAAALQASLARLRELEAGRQQALAALAAFDADTLRAERHALDQRRDSLLSAEKVWTELDATRDRLRQSAARAQDIGAGIAAANTLLAAAESETAGIDAARMQAERSCDAAKLACGASVTRLRSTLEDGTPCPVCGSEAHPYQHQDETLQAMLASLEAEVERCRALAAHNLSVQSTQRAVIAAGEQQRAAAMREQSVLTGALEKLEPVWAAHPLAAQAPADAGRQAWFAAQLQQVRESGQQLDTREQAQRAAAQERDKAQAACDRGATERDHLHETAVLARSALAQAGAAHAALAERRAQAAANAGAVLDELDAASGDGRAWRGEWSDDPARFRAQCASFAAQWTAHSQQQAALASSLAAMDIEQGALQKRCEHAEELAAQARTAFAQVDNELLARQRERAALWDGRPVQEVEAGLGAALEAARLQLAGQQAAREKAAHAETRARESLAHNSRRLGALQVEAQAAGERLGAWLAGFGGRHPGLETVDGATLAALLARDPASIEHERSALASLDAGASSAATVLAERRERHALHHQGTAADTGCPPAELPGALAALLEQRRLAHDAATALRLQLAQDNVRRENSQSVADEIEAQRALERRWGQMNELIGSADGKKFRNYAQQFTLDVLLGYANSHLAHLARRYRLERVATSSGPSLGLLVRDQDMGGEIRSVNSLSGGESFLVSLALALGLASLSSNRVRVESLFIDEGFGSLDSDTLRVAMDALDGLQSMGRKVGVISHVQEMTERIATKILVQPAGGGTSSVTVQ